MIFDYYLQDVASIESKQEEANGQADPSAMSELEHNMNEEDMIVMGHMCIQFDEKQKYYDSGIAIACALISLTS